MGIWAKIKGWLGKQEVPAPPLVLPSRSLEATRLAIAPVSLSKLNKLTRTYEPPHIDISQVDNAYNGEAYVRRALDKHTELMFKAGWNIIGEDDRVVDYVKLRLALIAEATRIPTNQLFIDIADDLVKYSNAVVIKARRDIALAGVRVIGLAGPPVAGYFPMNINYVEVEKDAVGNIYTWRFNIPGGTTLELKPQDVIHFYYKREKNRVFGTPYLIPVLGDITALRQAEEGVLKLIYRHIYPFLHHIIGSEKEGYEGTDEEVAAAKTMIEQMDLEAGLVTTERHKIIPIALDQVIDAYNYLRYFEQRVFTGLGVSEVVMGRGGAANRSTAESQYTELRETVKAIQQVMETFVNFFIINELLREGGYEPLLNPRHAVYFKFREIDVDMQIKLENHAVYKYITNTITEDEMRAELGKQPITDRSRLFYNLVTIPVAQATGKNQGASPDDVTNRNQPTNQPKPAGKPGRPAKAAREALSVFLDNIRATVASEEALPPRFLIDSTVAFALQAREAFQGMPEDLVGQLNALLVTGIHTRSPAVFDALAARLEAYN